jgi:hypothetical protein
MSEFLCEVDVLLWRVEQSRMLVQGCPKQLAADLGVTVDTLYRWGQGAWPIPAYQAFRLSAAQQDFRYLQLLAERAGTILLPRRPVPLTRPIILLLADLTLSFGGFYQLTEKLNREEPLSDDEMRRLEELGEAIKRRVDTLIERARQRR